MEDRGEERTGTRREGQWLGEEECKYMFIDKFL